MNPVLVLVGLALAGFGGWAFVVRHRNRTVFSRLESMQQTFGDTAGTVVHLFAFTLLPIAIGLFLVDAGIKGTGLF